ncbi:hypothetical protein AB0H73_39015 [Streptomyces olivoreticuli]
MPDPTNTPLAPMTPDAAISAFNYLRAVQADDTVAAAEFAGAEPRMPALLVDVAERIVVPITALLRTDVAVPCDDAFAWARPSMRTPHRPVRTRCASPSCSAARGAHQPVRCGCPPGAHHGRRASRCTRCGASPAAPDHAS